MDNQRWRGGAKEREQGERILNHENNPQARCAQHPAGTSKNSLCGVILTSLLTSERVCQQRESTGTAPGTRASARAWDVILSRRMCGQSCLEHAGISVIIDVSARALRTQEPVCTELGPSQMDKISPPQHTDQAVPAGIASTHIPDHRNTSTHGLSSGHSH